MQSFSSACPMMKLGGGRSGVPALPSSTVGYIAGIDGLRAIAVLAVVAYHLDAPWMGGGFLGVDMFMVLSGFLITRLLTREVDRTGSVAVPDFWIRRAKRLLPAALFVIMTATAAAALFYSADQLRSIRGDALAALLYVANWRFIAASQSYFDLFAQPSPFRHLWSLAIEEQFYVVWPAIVLLARRRQSVLVATTVGLTVASVVAMFVLVGDADPSRAYYGTDTRAQTLLIGCLLALYCRWRQGTVNQWAAPAALLGLASIVAALVLVDDNDRWMYRGGFSAFALCSAVVVLGVLGSPKHRLTRVLETWPMLAIGRGSYSIYLWHWPVIVFATPQRLHMSGWHVLVVRLAIIAALTFVSYRYVEQPIRHREFPRIVAAKVVLCSALVAVLLVYVVTIGARPPADFFAADGAVASNEQEASAVDTPLRSVRQVLVLGDSVVASLSDQLLVAASAQQLPLATAPVSGCGLLPGLTLDTVSQRVYEESGQCASAVAGVVSNAFRTTAPDVVVWLSIWDAENRAIDDRRIELETPEGRAALTALIDQQVRDFNGRGASVVLVTVPVLASVDSRPAPFPQKQTRISSYNEVLIAYAAEHPNTGVVDLAAHICPSGDPCDDLDPDGNRFRPTDGIHYEGAAAATVAAWLVEEIMVVASRVVPAVSK